MFTHIATICVIYLLFVQTQSKTVNETEIKLLEKEKQEVLKQLNEAIQESVKVLEKSNDSQSLASLNYIKEIKENIVEMNDSVPLNNTARRTKDINMHIFEMFHLPPDAKTDRHRKIAKKGNKARHQAQAKMQAQIDEWLFNREKERQRIKKMRESMRTTKSEKCPNFGKEAERKRKKQDRHKESDRVYPCCRKCCKKSYMGCL